MTLPKGYKPPNKSEELPDNITLPKGYKPPNKSEELPDKIHANTRCINCNSDNTIGSKFCIKCGISISTSCLLCGNANNRPDASFCNQCGSKLRSNNDIHNMKNPSLIRESLQNNIISNFFLEYILPEYSIKVNYPSTWRLIDENELSIIVEDQGIKDPAKQWLVAFRPIEENSIDPYLESLVIIRHDLAINTSIDSYAILSLNKIKGDSSLILDELVKITLAGLPGYRIIYTECGRKKHLSFTMVENSVYLIVFTSELGKYFKYLSFVEQMISSFEYLFALSEQPPIQPPTQLKKFEGNFLEFIVPEHNIKMKYPSSWTKFDKPNPNLVAMFKPLKEHLSDTFDEMVVVSVTDSKGNIKNLKEYIEANINDYKSENSDFVLDEYSETTLAGAPAYQVIYTAGGTKYLFIMSIRQGKEYYIGYLSKPERYLKNLSFVEQMISSFEFLEGPLSGTSFGLKNLVNEASQIMDRNIENLIPTSYPDLIISSVSDYTEGDYFHIVGEVMNKGTTLKQFVQISVTIYDEKNTVIGTQSTYTNPSDIPAGGSAPFKIFVGSSDVTDLGVIKSYKIPCQ